MSSSVVSGRIMSRTLLGKGISGLALRLTQCLVVQKSLSEFSQRRSQTLYRLGIRAHAISTAKAFMNLIGNFTTHDCAREIAISAIGLWTGGKAFQAVFEFPAWPPLSGLKGKGFAAYFVLWPPESLENHRPFENREEA